MSREDPRDIPTRYAGSPHRDHPRAIVDEVDRLLAAEEEVPVALAVALVVALDRRERERWLRVLAEHAWRPDNLPPRS